jgi:hypothetical protein
LPSTGFHTLVTSKLDSTIKAKQEQKLDKLLENASLVRVGTKLSVL